MASRPDHSDRSRAPGGIEGRPEVERAAQLLCLGLDGMALLGSSDPNDYVLAAAVAQHLPEYRRRLFFRPLAVEIVNALGEAMKS